MWIEGKNVVLEALLNDSTINKLIVQKNLKDEQSNTIIQLAKQKNIRIDFVDKFILDKKSPLKKHQGFLAETVEFNYCDIEEILDEAKKRNEDNFIVILDGIEDPHNLGAIIRSCECAGVHGIIISKHRSVSVNETVIKTSAGAVINMKIARVTNINQTIDQLKSKNIWVYGCEINGEKAYNKNLTGNVALVVGSEGLGISKLTLSKCDDIISLPMRGQINSLNASVAAGIMVYEVIRQRTK